MTNFNCLISTHKAKIRLLLIKIKTPYELIIIKDNRDSFIEDKSKNVDVFLFPAADFGMI